MHHIELDENPDHDAHGYDEEAGRFKMCTPIIVHCESKEEALDISKHISEHFGEDDG